MMESDASNNPPSRQQREVEEQQVEQQQGRNFCCAFIDILSALPEGELDNVILTRVVYHSGRPGGAVCHIVECKWDITGLPLSDDPWPPLIESRPIYIRTCDKIWRLELEFSEEENPSTVGCCGADSSRCARVTLDAFLHRMDEGADGSPVKTTTYVRNEDLSGAMDVCKSTFLTGSRFSVLPRNKCTLLPLNSRRQGFRATGGLLHVECTMEIENCCFPSR